MTSLVVGDLKLAVRRSDRRKTMQITVERDGGLTMSPGSTLRFRYRVIIHPGDTAAAGIAGLYGEFAKTK